MGVISLCVIICELVVLMKNYCSENLLLTEPWNSANIKPVPLMLH